jgi:lysophospholipase L1-like esterase
MAARMPILVLLCLILGTLASGPAAAAARPWRLVALGDSIPYGGRYCNGCTPYPSLLAADLGLRAGRRIIVRNLGVPGLTTAQLLARVRTRADVRAAIAAADIVTITIGHNDTPWNSRHDTCDGARAWFGPYRDARWTSYAGSCLAHETSALRGRLDGILGAIRALRGGAPTLLEVTTDWNQVIGQSGVTSGARAASKSVLDGFATAVCVVARARAARCGDVYHAFNGSNGRHEAVGLLAADHDHASQAGHSAIARLLAGFGFAPLTL